MRRAVPGDAGALTEIWLAAFAAALPTVRTVHSAAEVRRWMGEVVIARQETWVADIDGSPAGFVSLTGDDVDQLYLAPDRRGQGLGDLLIEKAKAQRPGGLSLWTFQVNEPAYRFYLRHGFREVERTDGEHNEEREPDIRMRWQPRGR